MKFCPNCRLGNKDSSIFCKKCGTSLDAPIKGKTSSAVNKKSIYIISILATLVLCILAASYFLLGENKEKSDFINKYAEAISVINKGEFEKGKGMLESFVEKDKYDEFDVNRDIKITTELDKMVTSLINEEEGISSKYDEFKKLYKNKLSDFDKIVADLESDVKYYDSFVDSEKKLVEAQKNSDIDSAKKELDVLKGYTFKIEKISKKMTEKIESLKQSVEDLSNKPLASNNTTTTPVNNNSGLHGWSKYEIDRGGVPFYEIPYSPGYAMTPRMHPQQQVPITFNEFRDRSNSTNAHFIGIIEEVTGRSIDDMDNKELGQIIIELSYTGELER